MLARPRPPTLSAPGGADDEHRIPVMAAKTLELTIPPSVLLRADRVIG